MNIKYIFVVMFSLFIISGCSGSYNFEENNFNKSNDDVNIELNTGENNSSIDVKISKLKNKTLVDVDINLEQKIIDKANDAMNNLSQVLDFSKFKNGNLYINSLINGSDNVVVEVKDLDDDFVCSFKKSLNLVKGDNSISFDGCELKDGSGYKITIISTWGEFSYNIISDINLIDEYIENNEEKDDDDDNEIKLEIDFENKESVYLKWNAFNDKDNFKYYKVVHSTTNSDLKYPVDGYISVITDIYQTSYVDVSKFSEGTNFYRITVVLKDDTKVHSNVEFVDVDIKEDNYEELGIEDDLWLNMDFDANQVYLEWNKPSRISGFKYYKVVHSTTNSDLKYPDDGYITYISNIDITTYSDLSSFEEGINYYRITYVFDDEKLNGDVIELNIEGENKGNITEENISECRIVDRYFLETPDPNMNMLFLEVSNLDDEFDNSMFISNGFGDDLELELIVDIYLGSNNKLLFTENFISNYQKSLIESNLDYINVKINDGIICD